MILPHIIGRRPGKTPGEKAIFPDRGKVMDRPGKPGCGVCVAVFLYNPDRPLRKLVVFHFSRMNL